RVGVERSKPVVVAVIERHALVAQVCEVVLAPAWLGSGDIDFRIFDIQPQSQVVRTLPPPMTGLEEHQIEAPALQIPIATGRRGRYQDETILLLHRVERAQQLRYQPLRVR